MMNDATRDLLDSIRNLCRAGAAQTGHSMHYHEGCAGNGWQHAHITIHTPSGGLVSLRADISPDGCDVPASVDEWSLTLREIQQRLTDYIATHRKQEAA